MAVRKKTEQGAEPLMAKHEASASATRTRRNRAADIVRTDRFRNIENGMIPLSIHGEWPTTPISKLGILSYYVKRPIIISQFSEILLT